ncbi:hypothetical protein IEE91_04955 [Kocuria sp. cx-455]|uniref:hypothetical protein n=1 Tax=Kocuria sp. cx-455 TaxID=2771377 RepID=UPI001685025E|nr:hypothetical protein [Kocuria sp. cx-455]MBD2764551.1 hypothetical protein [Kocuria sp. cx-455]
MSRTARTPVNPAPWHNGPETESVTDEPAEPGEITSTTAASAPPSTLSAVVTTVITGLLIGSVAAVMHANIWYLSESVWLPWGLLFSGALVWFASVWCGTATRRVWAAAVPGLLSYVLSWAFAYLKNGSALVVTSWEAPIGMVGYAWFAVIFVAVMAAVIVTGRYITKLRRQARG